jgi:polyhydroxyalkanoate synthesis regulator phasin
LLECKSKRQIDHYKEEMVKLRKELEVENKAMLANGGAKSQKAKVERLEEQISKLQE